MVNNLDRIPGTPRKDNDPDQNLRQDAESDDPATVVKNLSDELLDDAWDTEVQHWAELGIHPGQNISVDMFHLRSKFDIVLEIFLENGLIEEETFNNRVKRLMLTNMIELRKHHQKMMLQAKLMEGIRPPIPKPGMFLPPGVSPNG